MNCTKKIFLLNVFLVVLLFDGFSQTPYVIWFDEPAEYFEQSLVLGNGKMGATVFGGVESEMIYLNDATLWAGEPVDPFMNSEAYKHIPEIRKALEVEDYRRADSLNRQVQGSFSESFAPLGTVHIDFIHEGIVTGYQRKLDIGNAISTTTYLVDKVKFEREYFVSHPDKLMVVKLKSDHAKQLNFDLKFSSLLKYSTLTMNNQLNIHGHAPYHAEPVYRGDIPDAVLFDENRGTRFTTIFKIENSDGIVTNTDSILSVREASDVTIYVSVATSFNGYDKDPAKEGLDDRSLASHQLNGVQADSFEAVRNRHLKDYKGFFNRVKFDLGTSLTSNLSIDDRLRNYAEGGEDKGLEILYFQFGRYLLISSSRTTGVPANLQGIWNPYMRPPWSSNYTMNINVEENYWLAESANLSEMHNPLLSFIENVSNTGKITAKTFYGVNKGWTACHNSDIWAMSNPVGDFGVGHPVWANWNMSGAWLSTHLWEHYVFTQDTIFLKSNGYPLMKGAAEFCLGWLTEDINGNKITSPSTSPENLFLTPQGYAGATLYGATADLAMIRELFIQTIRASEVLGIDLNFRQQLESTLKMLFPYQIGKKGNLQEWYHDWEDNDPQHRHQSHLFGLYPGNHISPDKTPDLADACRKSLEIKGDESTGWSKGWRINLWARLRDGNHAYKMYRTLLRYVDPTGTETNYSNRGGTYPNLLDAHPPFQIDGNFGGAAGVIEMLLQSNEEEIMLLPAIPDAWEEGHISGICSRGGFQISMNWKHNDLESVTVYSKNGGKTTLSNKGKKRKIVIPAGEELIINW